PSRRRPDGCPLGEGGPAPARLHRRAARRRPVPEQHGARADGRARRGRLRRALRPRGGGRGQRVLLPLAAVRRLAPLPARAGRLAPRLAYAGRARAALRRLRSRPGLLLRQAPPRRRPEDAPLPGAGRMVGGARARGRGPRAPPPLDRPAPGDPARAPARLPRRLACVRRTGQAPMTRVPDVSVVIPTRDRWRLLSTHALPSALAQEDVEVEVIVVDDGSS